MTMIPKSMAISRWKTSPKRTNKSSKTLNHQSLPNLPITMKRIRSPKDPSSLHLLSVDFPFKTSLSRVVLDRSSNQVWVYAVCSALVLLVEASAD